MLKKLRPETKVGIFATCCLFLIAFITIKVSDRSVVAGGGYKMQVIMQSAIGLKTKTPVEIAGIQIGVVKEVELNEMGKANVTLLINKSVKLPQGTTAYVRSKGFLGETFVELRLGPMDNDRLSRDGSIPYAGVTGDVNLLLTQFNEIATDIKVVTGSLKGLVGEDRNSPVYRTVHNLDEFSSIMKDITIRNEQNFNKVVHNLTILTEQLKGVIERRRYELEETIAGISSITRKVDQGEGTLGRLVNDDSTIDKLNSAVDSLSDALGGIRKMETQIGYHTEYLGGTGDVKQYVHLNLLPSPDKGFLFEFVSDPAASPTRTNTTTDIMAGGATSRVVTNSAEVKQDEIRFSAQLAKKFYDFTLRGGIIESTGGVGLDFDKGPLSVQFSAFDFDTKYGQKPHLKALGAVGVTKNLFIIGGVDDFINPNQPVDWFVGAGVKLVDEDIKSLFGLAASAAK